MKAKEHIALLGLRAEDKVTGFKGVVTSVSFDLFGCLQVVLTPAVDKNGAKTLGEWFDVARLTITGKTPVMEVPNFDYGVQAEGRQGASEKPICGKY